MEYITVQIKKPGEAVLTEYTLEKNSVNYRMYIVLPDGSEVYFPNRDIVDALKCETLESKITDLEDEFSELEEERDRLKEKLNGALHSIKDAVKKLEK